MLFYLFASFTEWRHEEPNLGRSKTESGSPVFIFHQQKAVAPGPLGPRGFGLLLNLVLAKKGNTLPLTNFLAKEGTLDYFSTGPFSLANLQAPLTERQFFCNFSAIVVWIWMQQVFLHSWSYDNGWLRVCGKQDLKTCQAALVMVFWPMSQGRILFSIFWLFLGDLWFFSRQISVFSDSMGWICPIWVLKKSKTA